jgi:hypothetical protein
MPAVSLPCEPASFRKQVEYPAYLYRQFIYGQIYYCVAISGKLTAVRKLPTLLVAQQGKFDHLNDKHIMAVQMWL